jgi:SAM-dependent methyltransferase
MSEMTARELAAGLEKRGQAQDEVTTRASYLELLGITPGERVLEVGCGTGVVLRDLARRVKPGGMAVGLDPGPHFLAIAAELIEQAGLSELTELREGDARALPFGDGEFDAVLAVTTLSHVPNGDQALREMVRVLRPSGRVGLLDHDADATIVSHPDRTLTRRIIAAASDHRQADSWIGRRFPGLLTAAGVRDVRVRAFTTIEQDRDSFYANQARNRATFAVQAGVISADEQRRWVEALEAEMRAGGFIAVTQLFVWGTRPRAA